MFQKLDSAKLSKLGKFQDQHYHELVDGFKIEISSDDGLEGTGRKLWRNSKSELRKWTSTHSKRLNLERET